MKSVRFSTQFPVLSRQADANGRLSVRAIIAMLFDAADLHAAQWNVSLGQLSQGRPETWVLNRLYLRLDRHPEWDEEITVTTWPSGAKRILAGRDFELTVDGRPIGRASTLWLMIDRTSRRPVSLPDFVHAFEPPPESPVVDETAKWAEPERSSARLRAEVDWIDLDLNDHASAPSYVEWLLRPLDPERLKTCELAGLDILFKSEAFLGEEIAVYLDPLDAPTEATSRTMVRFTHLVERATDRTVLATARSSFRTSS